LNRSVNTYGFCATTSPVSSPSFAGSGFFPTEKDVQGSENLSLDIHRDAPAFPGFLHLLVRQLIRAQRNEFVIIEPNLIEKGIERLHTEVALRRFFHLGGT
jgi:hypothetical protein